MEKVKPQRRFRWFRCRSGAAAAAGLLALAGCAVSPASPGDASPAREDLPVARETPLDRNARDCIALAMYWEARGEGRQGMQAVGSVILNRVADERFPNSACAVVTQGGETPPCQFSWWCDGKSDQPSNRSAWSIALSEAEQLLTARPQDATRGALFFHNKAIRRPWPRQKTASIGNHVFYR